MINFYLGTRRGFFKTIYGNNTFHSTMVKRGKTFLDVNIRNEQLAYISNQLTIISFLT